MTFMQARLNLKMLFKIEQASVKLIEMITVFFWSKLQIRLS